MNERDRRHESRFTVVVAATLQQAETVARREGLRRWKPAARPRDLMGYGPECRFIQVEPPLNADAGFYQALDELRRIEARGAAIEVAYT